MKLTELKIENFRSFEQETIHFDDYTCLVGPNGSGKSAILMALNVFFRENSATVTDVCVLTEEDFHHKNVGKSIRITVTFEDLCEEAQKDFKRYYRQGKLIIFAQAVWDETFRSATVKHYGSRLVMKEFKKFFEAIENKAKVADLRTIYNGIKGNYPGLPDVDGKDEMTNALRDYEEQHSEKCELIDEPNQFYGFTKGEYRLDKYIQWVYIPAVKDASVEQDEGGKSALGKILARTVRTKMDFSQAIETLKADTGAKYQQIVDAQQNVLSDLQLDIEKRLQDYMDPQARLNLIWHCEPESSVTIREPVARALIGDGPFIGGVARAGHGLQRAFLVALLHELVGNEEKGGPKLLLGFEEPELYQHPPQAQHLANVLERLAGTKNNSQVIVTTHSPYFVSSRGFENVRMVRKIKQGRMSKVSWSNYDKMETRLSGALQEKAGSPTGLMARVSQIMQPSQNELFFAGLAVLVEGEEDVGYIATHLVLSEQLSEFRRLGCHFVIADGKTNLSRLAAMALELEIPIFVIFDADGNVVKKDPGKRKEHERDNGCILRLCSVTDSELLPEAAIWRDGLVMWPSRISDTIHDDFGVDIWDKAANKVRQELGLHNGVSGKNKILIAGTLEELWRQEKKSATLMRLCSETIRYAQKMQI